MARRGTFAIAACAVAALATPGAAAAQMAGFEAGRLEDSWRINAAVGAFVPRAPLIVAADGRDTQLGAGPSFSLELQYLAASWAAIFANGTGAFSNFSAGTEISPAAVGPSDQVTVIGLTGGVVFAVPAGSFSEHLEPTVRIGGGIKGYSFDLDGADSQWRPTGDFGLGLRAFGAGPLEISAEVRYLPSSFDQGKLPTRGITPQTQRQTDLLFSVGVSVRP